MSEMVNGTFRYKKGYTTVQNSVAKSPTLSLKAKGLYLSIQANITNPERPFSKKQLLSMLPEGEKALNNAWNELKEAGFLKIHSYFKGYKQCIYEYELLDEAQLGPHTFKYNSKGELIYTNEDEKE